MQRVFSKFTLALLILSLWATACQAATGSNNQTETPTSGGLATAAVEVVSVPDVQVAATTYLDAWKTEDYATMYANLTSLSRDAISFEEFETWYRALKIEGVLSQVDYEITQMITNPTKAQVAYRVTLVSNLAGEIARDTTMNLSLENGRWGVAFDHTLVLPELAGGGRFSMQLYTPTRGNIYDQQGLALAAYGEAVAVQVLPSFFVDDPDYNSAGLISQLSTLSGLSSGYISTLIFADDAPFLTPIAVVPLSDYEDRRPFLEPYFDVMRIDTYFTRLYPVADGGAHMVGYTGGASDEEVDSLGVPVGAVVGKLGVEAWGDSYLTGRRGGDLYVVDSNNNLVTILNGQAAVPSESIYLTVDRDLQQAAQQALGNFTGAVVVLERDTGRVLAMASSPTFDPNGADPGNPVSEWSSYFPDTEGRFFNRATQGLYPPGSVFKVISMAAALETGKYEPISRLDCPYIWDRIPGAEYEDWTLAKDVAQSGNLSLVEGLMRSCNPWFYEIGYVLYTEGEGTAIADMAHAFGLGQPTGIGVLPEASGQINAPDDISNGSTGVDNAVQQGIGQADTLITPLQAAAYAAALGNGGTLYQPQLIEFIESTDGATSMVFEPIVTGELPISADTLDAIRLGMKEVITNTRGTAYRQFANFPIAVFGKTGTAQVGGGLLPHAWFIGFTSQNNPDLPDLAIAVLVENIGDGSEFAAPIFKRIVEDYFYGQPQSRFPWETRIGEFDPTYFDDEPVEEATPTEEPTPEGG